MSVAAAHLDIAVEEPSQVGEARRAAVQLAERLGFDEVATGRVALVATELGTNLVRHAVGGRLLIAAHMRESGGGVEILSLDRGPGMADIDRCLQDGYSTSTTPGGGLGAVRRLADEFDAYSSVPGGTVIAARLFMKPVAASRVSPPDSSFLVGAISLNALGETVCGDAWSFAQQGSEASLAVADGLGHGPDAAAAAAVFTACFDAAPYSSPSRLLEAAHAVMRATRGAAASVARLDVAASRVTFSGAGNVVGRIVSGVEDRTLLSQHGTLGLQIRHLHDDVYPWPEHAVVVLHSDGIVSRWSLAGAPGILRCHPAVIAGWLVREYLRGKDDATVVVVRRA